MAIFLIFQDGGRRHLGFLFFFHFNGRSGQEYRTTSLCQIYRNRSNCCEDIAIFGLFKMATAVILDFKNLKFLTVVTVKRVKLHHYAKFRQNRWNHGRDIAIFRFFKTAAAVILNFRNIKFLIVVTVRKVKLHQCAKFR